MIPESKIKAAIKVVVEGLGVTLHSEPQVCVTTIYLHDKVVQKYQIEFAEELTPIQARKLYATK